MQWCDVVCAEFMHVGLAVDDLEALRNRLHKAGYLKELNPKQIMKTKHRHNMYVEDDDGLQWEFVQ